MIRNQSIDVAKGLGILAVVGGHVAADAAVRDAIFLWHMPLFFFISGMLFNPKRGATETAMTKARSLLVPYAAFLMVLALPHLANAWKRGGSDELAAFAGRLAYGGRDLTGWFSVFWFVTCLYATQVVAAALIPALRRRMLVAVALVALAGAYVLQQFAPDLRSPGNVAVVAFALPIFIAGHLFGARPITSAALVGALLAVSLAAYGAIPSIDMKGQQYGMPLVTLAAAMACALAVLKVAGMLAGTTAGRAASRLGAASLVIMFTHQAVQLIVLEKLHMESQIARMLAALAVGWLAYEALRRFPVTRAVFLGEKLTAASPATALQRQP